MGRGRKRKSGKREPNGKLSRRTEHKQERRRVDEQVMMSVAKDARVRLWGVSYDLAGTAHAGSVVGRLVLMDRLTQEQADVAQHVQGIYERYRRAIDAPPRPGAVDLNRVHGLGTGNDMSPEQCAVARKAWADVQTILLEANMFNRASNLFAAMDYLVLRDEYHPHMVGDLRLALNALGRYYRSASKAA